MSTAKVVPIRELGHTAYIMIKGMFDVVTDLPADEMLPGYRLLPESMAELGRMVSLLQESRQLLTQALERESPRFSAYSGHLEARKL